MLLKTNFELKVTKRTKSTLNVNIWNIYFELRIKDQIEERSSQLVRNLSSCEKEALKNTEGQKSFERIFID